MVETHPSTEQLQAFAAGRLSDRPRAAVEAHLIECEGCWVVVEQTQSALPIAELLKSLPPELRDRLGGRRGSQQVPPPQEPPTPPAELRDHPRYQILDCVGQGGMGVVWKARHLLMNRTVALKVIRPALLRSPSAAARFRREVEAAARLDHPNIVRAFDAEEVKGVHFLVMEFVEGVDLARLVRERGPLPVAEACQYARQVALALRHADERGMVHRDIKPHNLMRTPDGVVKVLDFGLAAFLASQDEVQEKGVLSTEDGAVTRLGDGCGTPDYISPEQVRDAKGVDIRADIYSLGCTLYHLLAGQPPFAGGTGYSKVAGHLERTPRPLSDVRADLPPALLEVLDRMLAKEPTRRFQTPGEVAEALAPFEAGGRGTSRSWLSRRKLLAGSLAGLGAIAGGWWVSSRRGAGGGGGATKRDWVIAHWRFEEGEDDAVATGKNSVLDSSGNGLHGTPVKGPVYRAIVPVSPLPQTGEANSRSLDFNGAFGVGVFVPDHPLFELAHSLTLEAFVNPRSHPPKGKQWEILFRGDLRWGLDPYSLDVVPDGLLRFTLDDLAGKAESLVARLPVRRWTHVAGTLDGDTGEMKLYLDGQLAASRITGLRPCGPLDPAQNPGLGIGNYQTPHDLSFNGLIDEVRICNKALRPDQFLNAAGGAEPGS